jgi:cell division protease FtsH
VTTGAENDFQVVTDLARRMVTRWGMSEQVGVVFVDDPAGAGGAGLNMRRIDALVLPVQARALVADADGHLLLQASDEPTHQHRFAMTSKAATTASSTAMATLINAEVQRILAEWQQQQTTLRIMRESSLRRYGYEQRRKKYRFQG